MLRPFASPPNELSARRTIKSASSTAGTLQPSPYRERRDKSCLPISASRRFQIRSPAASASASEVFGKANAAISLMLLFLRFTFLLLNPNLFPDRFPCPVQLDADCYCRFILQPPDVFVAVSMVVVKIENGNQFRVHSGERFT